MKRLSIFTLALLAACAARSASEFEYQNAIRQKYGQPLLTQAEFDELRHRGLADEEKHEAQRLVGAGFVPAGDIRKQGRTLVRASYSEPRLFLRMPGITLERVEGGAILSLTSDGRAPTGRAAVPLEKWQELQRLEAAAFAPDPSPTPLAWRNGDPVPDPPPVCHGWGAVIERVSPARADKVWGWECDRSEVHRARLDYALRLAAIALTEMPQCQALRQTLGSENSHYVFGRLGRCLGKFDPETSNNR
jgi:hypothetical protein